MADSDFFILDLRFATQMKSTEALEQSPLPLSEYISSTNTENLKKLEKKSLLSVIHALSYCTL